MDVFFKTYPALHKKPMIVYTKNDFEATNSHWVKQAKGSFCNAFVTEMIKKNAFAIVIVLSYILLIFLAGADTDFIDEYENIYKAQWIVDGDTLFADFYTQHTPLMYYLLFPFIKMGVNTIVGLRICVYTVIFGIWIFAFIRYRSILGHSVAIYPLLYVLFSPLFWGHMMLSDVIQGNMILVAFFEVQYYLRENRLTITRSIVFSISIFCSIGTAFLSVYSLFSLALIVIIHEIRKYFDPALKNRTLLKTHSILLCIVLLPFMLYLIYLLARGVLETAVYYMYTFNREVYSEYTVNHLGASAGGAVIQTFKVYFQFVASQVISGLTLKSILAVLLVVTSWIGLFRLKLRLKFTYTTLVLLGLTLIFSGIRGFSWDQIDGIGGYGWFHSTPYQYMSLFLFAFVMCELMKLGNRINFIFRIIASMIFIFMIMNGTIYYTEKIPESFTMIQRSYHHEAIGDDDRVLLTETIKTITGSTDTIFTTSINYYSVYYDTNRKPPHGTLAITPFGYESSNSFIIEKLESSKPTVILYNPEHEVWGEKYSDFMPEILAYLNSRYRQLFPGNNSILSDIYVRSDYYLTAKKYYENSSG